MSHASMLKTRRKRQKGKKDLAVLAKRAKKQAKLAARKGATAPKKKSA